MSDERNKDAADDLESLPERRLDADDASVKGGIVFQRGLAPIASTAPIEPGAVGPASTRPMEQL